MSKRRRCRNVVTVVNVLKEQGVLTIDIQEAFRRGNVDALIFSNKDAVLIKHSCGAYMLWAATVEAGRLFTGKLLLRQFAANEKVFLSKNPASNSAATPCSGTRRNLLFRFGN